MGRPASRVSPLALRSPKPPVRKAETASKPHTVQRRTVALSHAFKQMDLWDWEMRFLGQEKSDFSGREIWFSGNPGGVWAVPVLAIIQRSLGAEGVSERVSVTSLEWEEEAGVSEFLLKVFGPNIRTSPCWRSNTHTAHYTAHLLLRRESGKAVLECSKLCESFLLLSLQLPKHWKQTQKCEAAANISYVIQIQIQIQIQMQSEAVLECSELCESFLLLLSPTHMYTRLSRWCPKLGKSEPIFFQWNGGEMKRHLDRVVGKDHLI